MTNRETYLWAVFTFSTIALALVICSGTLHFFGTMFQPYPPTDAGELQMFIDGGILLAHAAGAGMFYEIANNSFDRLKNGDIEIIIDLSK